MNADQIAREIADAYMHGVVTGHTRTIYGTVTSYRGVSPDELKQRIAAALRAAHTAGFSEAKGRDWLPIETAPKDGTFILLYCPEDNSRWLASWQGGNWYGVDGLGLTRVGMGPDDVTGWRVTLWQPMPEPPATAIEAMKEGKDV